MPSGGGAIHEYPGKSAKPDVIIEDEDRDWILEDIMTAGEIETSEGRGKTSALRRNVDPQA